MKQKIKAFVQVFAATLIAFTLFRIAFYFIFHPVSQGPNVEIGGAAITGMGLLHAFALGLRFDARVAMLFSLPIIIFGLVPFLDWRLSRVTARAWSYLYTILSLLVTVLYGTDIGYYSYLESRVNITVLQFLKNPLISLQMLNETYHVWILCSARRYFSFRILALFFARGFIGDATNNYVKLNQPSQESTTTLGRRIGSGAAVIVFVLVCLWGSVTQYPLRWSDAFFSQNMFLAYLAMNPAHYFIDSIESTKQTYNTERTRAHYQEMAEYLGVPAATRNEQTMTFERPIDVESPPLIKGLNNQPPNVVYIVMESMAAYKTGLFGNAPDSSPSIDALAKEGWLFRNYYTPTEGTARSLFCVLTGIPDINAKSTSSRNPLIVNQNTLINALHEYEKFYFIGGSAAWGNIRGVYMNNVAGLKMYEGDSNLKGPRTDVWGLSDLDLFRATAKELREHDTNKPFFALVQSASYHRPFTIPPEHGDFVEKQLTDKELQHLGFGSNTEYNSFRFADYSLGEFFKLIKDSEFFKNTIFIIHGDHGLPHYDADHLRPGYKLYGINRFHVPLVFYSPLIQKHEEYATMMSETDVWPTLLGSLGVNGINTALGRNVLALGDQPHYAFSYVYYDEPLRIFLYDQKYLVSGTPKGVDGMYDYMGDKPADDLSTSDPERYKKMSSLLEGIFETSRYMLYHNPKKN